LSSVRFPPRSSCLRSPLVVPFSLRGFDRIPSVQCDDRLSVCFPVLGWPPPRLSRSDFPFQVLLFWPLFTSWQSASPLIPPFCLLVVPCPFHPLPLGFFLFRWSDRMSCCVFSVWVFFFLVLTPPSLGNNPTSVCFLVFPPPPVFFVTQFLVHFESSPLSPL